MSQKKTTARHVLVRYRERAERQSLKENGSLSKRLENLAGESGT